MTAFDTIIRGGLVVDGSGGPPCYADVGIIDGRIAKVGNLRGSTAREIIDAAGKIVAPGHVTQHTHYDAQLFWDPYCSNSGENGVTTVVNANCGFGFAPVRIKDRPRAMAMMESTEQIPVSHQKAGMPWDWETFPEFLDRVKGLPKGVNVMTYLPVNPLMIYVMGVDAAKTRSPTAAEMAEMHKLINEAMDAGAMGISMSAMGIEGNSHVDYDGSAMPTDSMDHQVAVDLAMGLVKRGEGIVQILSQIAHFGHRSVTERVAEACKGSGVRVVHNIFLTTDAVDEDLAWLDGMRARGLDVTAQTLAYRGWVEQDVYALDNAAGQLPSVRKIVACNSEAELRALLTSPDFIPNFEKEYAVGGATSGASGFEPQIILSVGKAEHLKPLVGKTLADVAAERGVGVVRALVELVIETDLALELKSAPIAAADPKYVLKLMANSGVSIGVSDGGAHTKSHALGSYGTDYLIWLVREEKCMTLEQIHYQLSLKAAQALCIRDRGAIFPGFWADILVYDLDRLHIDLNRMGIAHDMPNGDWRRKIMAGGYDRILVNGVTTHIADKPTGATPGQFVRVTQDFSAPMSIAAE